jgi:hypothetical protein
MATGEYRIGLNGTFKHGASGTTAVTTSDAVDDVTLNISKRMAEAVRRGKTFVAKKPVITEASIDFKVWDIVGDALVAALETAFFADSRIALFPTSEQSGKGLDADYYITQFNRQEDNEDMVFYNVKAEPTDEERDPSWTT